MKNIIVSLIVILTVLSCTREETIKPQPEVIDATCQRWYGGREETGKGSLYFIYLKTSNITYTKLRTDSLYSIKGRVFGDTTIICLRTLTSKLNRLGMLYFNKDSVEIYFNLIN